MLGGDSLLYEGRGWLARGASSGYEYNAKSLAVAFLGNYELDRPKPEQLAALEAFLEVGTGRGLSRGRITSCWATGRVDNSPGNHNDDDVDVDVSRPQLRLDSGQPSRPPRPVESEPLAYVVAGTTDIGGSSCLGCGTPPISSTTSSWAATASPVVEQFRALEALLDHGLARGRLAPDYKLTDRCELRRDKSCSAFTKELKKLRHWTDEL
ncbi:hypothetical protein TKK_0013162 [Trichogramma kaykai]